MSDDYITDKPEFTSADIQMYDREGNEISPGVLDSVHHQRDVRDKSDVFHLRYY